MIKKINNMIIVSIIAILIFISSAFSVNAQTTEFEVDESADINYWALIIGTDPVSYCNNDANDLYNVLVDNGWNSNNIKKYTATSATKENFVQGIKWLDTNEDSDDVVLFYFSGHGGFRSISFYDENSGYYDSNIMFLFMLKLRFLSLESNKIIFIFDTCHAGSLGAKKDPLIRSSANQILSESINNVQLPDEGDNSPNPLLGLSGIGKIVIASCRMFEYSYGCPEYENGFFTYYFVEGLKGYADSDSNGWVSAEEAFAYAKPRTIDDTRDDPRTKTQHPKMSDFILGQVDLTDI